MYGVAKSVLARNSSINTSVHDFLRTLHFFEGAVPMPLQETKAKVGVNQSRFRARKVSFFDHFRPPRGLPAGHRRVENDHIWLKMHEEIKEDY